MRTLLTSMVVGLSMWPLATTAEPPTAPAPTQVWLAVDADDDDGDGVVDSVQQAAVPVDDLVAVDARLLDGVERVSVRGGVARLVQDGVPHGATWAKPDRKSGPLRLQGLQVGSGRLTLTRADGEHDVAVRVVRLAILDAANRLVDPVSGAVHISLRVTNDQSLPEEGEHDQQSSDPRNLRLELVAPQRRGRAERMTVTAVRSDGIRRARLITPLKRAAPGGSFRSRFVRLVSDGVDVRAPGVTRQVLQVGLGDRLRVAWHSPSGWLSQDVYVGRPGREGGAHSRLLGRLRVVVLRSYPGGPPVIGRDDLSAMRIAREQVRTANESWAQCGITFGPARESDISLEAPPPPALLAIADGDGLPARGDGVLQLRVNGQSVGPVATTAGARPIDTAMDLARAIRDAGFSVQVTRNPRTQFGVHPTADLLVRSRSGELTVLSKVDDLPLSTDSRQRLSIGSVDLSDGLLEFNNMNARAGSLEERTLIKALADDDPATIDVFFINTFTNATRQGEAFIEASEGAIVNAVVIDRSGLRQRDTAWTLGHEVGHVLLDEPLHPDNIGADRPWLLMDSDSNRGTVYGPKRMTEAECQRARFESGPGAAPTLLTPGP